MTNVTIFGSGNMGTAIADIFKASGADVQFIGSDGQGTVEGDVSSSLPSTGADCC
ncbi:hypothetical protein [Corynebacterium casei]|uniref:hypothetical protein n=1 Tax=Corynebacterium casei TaxID=160386 RepID=UPI003F8F0E04